MVWLLVSLMRQGMPDGEILANYPTLKTPDLDAARQYARQHPDESEEAIDASDCDENERARTQRQ